jgi:hypothetical protein
MIECKFHSRREATSDVKVPLYVLSRFNDLQRTDYPVIFSETEPFQMLDNNE